MARLHNFSAGPAVLPVPVLEEARDNLLDLHGSGLGAMEYSHRSATFAAIIESARARLRRLLRLSDDQEVLFLHGGARTQFFQVPMNLLRGGTATYVDTGTWAYQAAAEARRYGAVHVPFSSREDRYRSVPRPGSIQPHPESVYLHYTSNNTVAGTELDHIPDPGPGWLVCDASSNILSRPIDGSAFDILYAGAQKNMGPSGVTVVVFRRALLDRCDPDLPTMLRYGTHVAKQSLYNTPNTWGIWILERVCAWLEEDIGGLAAMEARNIAQARRVYDVIDASDFWRGMAEPGSRSRMNVTFTTGDPTLDTTFHTRAAAEGLVGLKGHSSVGGLRASLYNAQTDEAVDALVAFMREFERTHG